LVKPNQLVATLDEALNGRWAHGRCPPLWDGHTAQRVIESLRRAFPA
jgi:hypothetical protein